MDFQDGECLRSRAWLGGRLPVLYESAREFARVHERFPLVGSTTVQDGQCRMDFLLALVQGRFLRLPARVWGRPLVWAYSRRSSRREDSRRLPDRLSGKLARTIGGALQSWIRRRERVLSCNCPFLQGIR